MPLRDFCKERLCMLRLRSPAKVNLYLDVLCKRTDGYHEVETILQSISLYDELEVEVREDGRIEVECDDPQVPRDEGNLAFKAAMLLKRAFKVPKGVKVAIKKVIPVERGLGGGSSNASFTLLALNNLWGLNLPLETLMELAREIGSDCPFFLVGGTCAAHSRGEKIIPLLPLKKTYLVLIAPSYPISTKWTYSQLCLQPRNSQSQGLSHTFKRVVANLREGRFEEVMYNRLELAVLPHYPALLQTKEELLRAGALASLMSGSGSAIFGLAKDESHAHQVLSVLQKRVVYPAWVVHTL